MGLSGRPTQQKETTMNGKQICLAIVLVAFLGFTEYAVYENGIQGLFDLVLANSATTLAFTDLTIALTLVSGWVIQDARRKGISWIPFLLITFTLGSAGPLLYLIRREWARA